MVKYFVSIVGGRSKSPYWKSASLKDLDTSIDVVVVQSTSNGNNPINCSHAALSTKEKNKKGRSVQTIPVFNIPKY